MKPVTTTLWVTAAVLLMAPALVQGMVSYALTVAVLSAAAVVLLRVAPHSLSSDVLLIAASAIVGFAVFLGLYPLFPIVALSLILHAWNTGHRFGSLERSPIEADAKRRFVLQQLALALISSWAVGLLLTAFLYVRIPLAFGLGLGLATTAFLAVALFIGFAHAARNGDEHGDPPRT